MGARSTPLVLLRRSHSLNSRPCSDERYRPAFMRVTVPLDIKAIVLVDNALYDATAWWRWLAQRLTRFNVRMSFDALYARWYADYLPDVCQGKYDRWSALNEFLGSIGLNRARIYEVIASSRAQYRQVYDNVHPLPGTVETLTQLANQRIHLVLLRQSRDSLDELNRTLRQWGVRQYFDYVMDGPNRSPADGQAEFLAGICKQIELPANRVAYVGRNEIELAAASSIGCTTIDCQGKAGKFTDLGITQIASLIGIVQQLPNMRRAG